MKMYVKKEKKELAEKKNEIENEIKNTKNICEAKIIKMINEVKDLVKG